MLRLELGSCPGCGKLTSSSGQFCAECAAKPKPAAVELQEWIDEGLLALERYLACWAAFDEWLTLHPPV